MRARLTEHAAQAAVVSWARLMEGVWPELGLLYAIPNGGRRTISVARAMKAEGVRPGMPDLHLPVARPGYIGFWLEMKSATGSASRVQRGVHERLRETGHLVVVRRDVEPAIEALLAYLTLGAT